MARLAPLSKESVTVGLCLAVEPDDFEDWYREQYRRVYASVLVVCGDRALAAEATDEAFTRALERWSRVRTMGSPAGWTFTVARNLLRRMARRAARERALSPAAVVAAPETSVALWDAVRGLPKRERELVALRYVADMTEPEIATTLGISVGTVSRGLHDARAHLRVMLAPQEEKT
jgi:RNA polymerase sigma factor (sigma-70 family)